MKIAITGSRGFIGGHLIELLKVKKDVKLFYCDLPGCNLLNLDSLKNFVSGKDVIIHAAAVNRGTDKTIIAGNVTATYNLISAIKKFKSRAKLIFLSSIQTETDTVYGLSKKLTEIMLEDFSQENKTPVSIFRLTNVFGERSRPFYNSVVATFCYQIANNQKLKIHSKSRNNKLNLIYVKDAAKIITKEIFMKRLKIFYFKRVSGNNEVTVSNLAKLITFFRSGGSKKFKNKFYRDLYKTYLSYL